MIVALLFFVWDLSTLLLSVFPFSYLLFAWFGLLVPFFRFCSLFFIFLLFSWVFQDQQGTLWGCGKILVFQAFSCDFSELGTTINGCPSILFREAEKDDDDEGIMALGYASFQRSCRECVLIAWTVSFRPNAVQKRVDVTIYFGKTLLRESY